MPTFQSFKDLSIALKPHPVTGDVATKKDQAAIRQSVSNLLSTRRTERLFNSQLGTNLEALLFELPGVIIESQLTDEISEILANYEPRININTLDITYVESEDAYLVELYYVFVGREDTLLSLELLLERP